jgi:hypothetical protein
VGWHRFGLLLRSDSSVTFFVDDQQVGTITGQFANANQVQVEGYKDIQAALPPSMSTT